MLLDKVLKFPIIRLAFECDQMFRYPLIKDSCFIEPVQIFTYYCLMLHHIVRIFRFNPCLDRKVGNALGPKFGWSQIFPISGRALIYYL